MNDKADMEKTKALMRSLVNMPPKQHGEMKAAKPPKKTAKQKSKGKKK